MPPRKLQGKFTDKTTGETIEVKPGKSSFTVEDRVPPFLPINWMDWLGDEHVHEMNETMWGVYFAILLELWQHERIEFDHKVLAARLRCRDIRNVRTFLEKWGHLFRCVDCGRVMQYPRRPHADPTQGSRNPHVEVTLTPCRYCADLTLCSCGGHAGYALHPKLNNYKNDVTNGLPLGTTKPNLTKQNVREANVTECSGADAPCGSFIFSTEDTNDDTEDIEVVW
jgi:ribosomal protein S27E